jgi:hypothetical protein
VDGSGNITSFAFATAYTVTATSAAPDNCVSASSDPFTIVDQLVCPPVAVDDSYTTDEDTPVIITPLDLDTDPNGDVLTITEINGTPLTPGTPQTIAVPDGTVTTDALGVITFTPDANFNGMVTFPYVITDGTATATANEIITVDPVNDPPVAVDDTYTVDEDNSVELLPLTADTDLDGDVLSIVSINGTTLTPGTPQTITVPNGTVDIDATGVITFTPDPDYNGPVTFPYVITDGTATDEANENIDVTPVNDPAIAIVKTGVHQDLNMDNIVQAGETIDYTFTVTNEGDASLGNITITDPLFEAPNAPVTISGPQAGEDANGDGMLDVSETWTFTATYVLTQEAVDAGEVVNQATVTGTDSDDTVVTDDSDNDNPLEDEPTITLLPETPGLAVIKGSSLDAGADGIATVGDIITYTYEVSNTGNVTLSGVALSETAFGGTGTPPVPMFASADLGSVEGILLVGETATYTATYALTQADINSSQVDNLATATGNTPAGTPVTDESDSSNPNDPNETGDPSDPEENDPTGTLLPESPGLGIAKEVVDVINNGDGTYRAIFLLTIENFGNVDLNDLVVTDDIQTQFAGLNPTGFETIDGTLSGSTTWDGSATSNVVADGQTIAVGQIETISIAFTVTPGEVITVDNIAGVTGTTPANETEVVDVSTIGGDPDGNDDDGNPDEDEPTSISFPENPGIGLAKMLQSTVFNGDGTYTLTYLLTVENFGDVDLTDLVVSDDLVTQYAAINPSDFMTLDGTLSGSPTWDGTATSNILAGGQTLAVGATGTVLIRLTVMPGTVNVVENIASVVGTSPRGALVDDNSTDGIDPDGNDNDDDPDEGVETITFFECNTDNINLGCIGNVNVTLDGDCSAVITPEMVVTGNLFLGVETEEENKAIDRKSKEFFHNKGMVGEIILDNFIPNIILLDIFRGQRVRSQAAELRSLAGARKSAIRA